MTLLALPTSAEEVLYNVVPGAVALMPTAWDTPSSRVQILATMGQESGFATRRQYGNGPARGLAQFERGMAASRGGVWGVYLHKASSAGLKKVCDARGVPFDPTAIWRALEVDDVLAYCVARLMLRTDPQTLPALGEQDAAWDTYNRIWRPGKPHPERWPANYQDALRAVEADA